MLDGAVVEAAALPCWATAGHDAQAIRAAARQGVGQRNQKRVPHEDTGIELASNGGCGRAARSPWRNHSEPIAGVLSVTVLHW
ncbi:hypothetical protein [Cupriavidus sp. H18C1]|uniref:hypothetical protein n=1 Tax=Cupriavidus sp. H18C1 TaxID=3241601 RepID=UPI003BB9521B